ncbi:hypothetical protein A2801_04100 [Candidatus Woesebacteria bacterium RIFCSPHIGHO2_01_FULL_41_10]|uniref:Uncharacterized protein n=1 Tax=Candidatus Woesebacteria bacterium RIFCSPHIGHO2_01_FULL_41_10 TaxID=1802500 RepID=A0A1F7YLG2_9BACT|nr:MAG: hypothetical protein A2801_04100 [Candidatus Woesebacteria bacterium RIFCSPHIGHO2_01_FULL_41_10]
MNSLPNTKEAKQLIALANEFINTHKKAYSTEDLAMQIHKDLQAEVKSLYLEVKNKIDFTSEQTILDSIAVMAAHSEHQTKTSSVGQMFPKHYRLYPGSAMECTLASSILKLALEEKGKVNVHTVLIKGHQAAIQEEGSGTIIIYDPSTRWTRKDGVAHGFSHRFEPSEIKHKKDLKDEQGKYRGFFFRLETIQRPKNTGMFESFDEKRQVYTRDFFASESDTLIELSVVLENLSDLSDKDSFSSLQDFDAKEVVKTLHIFDHKKLFAG